MTHFKQRYRHGANSTTLAAGPEALWVTGACVPKLPLRTQKWQVTLLVWNLLVWSCAVSSGFLTDLLSCMSICLSHSCLEHSINNVDVAVTCRCVLVFQMRLEMTGPIRRHHTSMFCYQTHVTLVPGRLTLNLQRGRHSSVLVDRHRPSHVSMTWLCQSATLTLKSSVTLSDLRR